MLISALCEYCDILAAQGKLSPEGYSKVGIHYLISLDENGKIRSIIDWGEKKVDTFKGKTTEKSIPRKELFPKRPVSTSIKAYYIDQRPVYIFGLNYDSDRNCLCAEDKNSKAKHEAFVKTNLLFTEGIDVPIVNAYRAFLKNWNPEQETENEILLSLKNKIIDKQGAGSFAFCLFGRPDILLHSVPELKTKWENEYHKNDVGAKLPVAQCCITGQVAPIEEKHEKIKGISGGDTTLICCNNASDESYGKKKSLNSSVSQIAMRKYTEALNHLLSDKKHSTTIGDTSYVYWAASANEEYDDLMSAFMEDTMDSERTDNWLSTVIKNIRAGKAAQAVADGQSKIDPNVRFYVVGLKPNSARLAVKCIYRQSFGSLLENVIQHYEDMQIGNIDKPIPLRRIGEELVLPGSKNESASSALMAKLLESVLKGTPYPEALLGTLVRRVKTDSDEEKNHFIQMNDIRLGLIKACINRNDRINGKEEEIKMSLDTENRSPAYLCGRLFCKLEEIQTRALGDLNRTIKDAYFASAATCPALTFPRLLRLSQHHLAKLDEKNAFFLDREVTQIMGLLESGFPGTLSLKEQGTFMLGYYQQKNEKFTKKPAADTAEDE